MDKKDFRKEQIKTLKNFLTTERKKKEDQLLAKKFLASEFLKGAQKIGITISMPLEVDTSKIIKQLWKMKKDVYIPRCLPKRKMEFTRFTSATKLTRTQFGTFENWNQKVIVDNQLDLIVVPGLAFGQDDHSRLGFGGGYYDRFLENKQLLTVALVNTKQLVPSAQWPVQKHDIAINKLITID